MAAFVFLLLLVPRAGIAGETSGRVRFQLGHEYDTNAPRRSASDNPDNLERLVVEGLLRYSTERHHLMLNYHGGLKLFYHNRLEDLIATKLYGGYTFDASKNWSVGGRLTLRDTTQKLHNRDYFFVDSSVFQYTKLSPWLELEIYAGSHYFSFKPDETGFYGNRNFSYFGPVAGLRLHIGRKTQVRTTASYQALARFVDDKAQHSVNGILQDSEEDRIDIRHAGGLKVRHPFRYWDDRKLILELSYFVVVNDTNSLGSAAIWHRLRLVIAMQLPLNITLSVMGKLQFTDFLDGIYVEGTLYEPDADENENSLVVRISFPLWKGLSMVLKGAVYRNAFHSGAEERVPFERETIMLGLAYDYSF